MSATVSKYGLPYDCMLWFDHGGTNTENSTLVVPWGAEPIGSTGTLGQTTSAPAGVGRRCRMNVTPFYVGCRRAIISALVFVTRSRVVVLPYFPSAYCALLRRNRRRHCSFGPQKPSCIRRVHQITRSSVMSCC